MNATTNAQCTGNLQISYGFLSVRLQKVLCFFAIVLSVAMSCSTYAGDDPVDPRLGKKMRLMAKSSSSGLDAPKASDIMFVTDSSTPNKGDLGQYLDGTITIPLEINRYFGDKKKLIKSEAIPRKVAVEFVTYDVDEDASYDPEVDYMYFNGKKIGQLRGSNGNYHRMLFLVDIDDVNLPTAPGTTAQNTITVQVDVNDGGWLTSIEWISLYIPAAPPVILSHGINSSGSSLSKIKKEINDLGIPAETFDQENGGSDTIFQIGNLTDAIRTWKANWHVDHVNIVGHSMGGLRARRYAEDNNDVFKVLQIGSPNGGSPLADYLIIARDHELSEMVMRGKGYSEQEIEAWRQANRKAWEKKVVWLSGKSKLVGVDLNVWRDKALEDLQTTAMASYNQRHKLKSGVEYRIVAGQVTWLRDAYLLDADLGFHFTCETLNTLLAGIDPRLDYSNVPTDMIVPVWSAHTLVSPAAGAPLRGRSGIAWHCGLTDGGAEDVVDILKPYLIEQKTTLSARAASGLSKSALKKSKVSAVKTSSSSTSSCFMQSGFVAKCGTVDVNFYIVNGGKTGVSLSWEGESVSVDDFVLKDPSGTTYVGGEDGVSITNMNGYVAAILANPITGAWTASFNVREGAAAWSLSVNEVDASVDFTPSFCSNSVHVGEPLVVRVEPKVDGVASVCTCTASVCCPDGSYVTVPFVSSGAASYTASVPTAESGRYQILVRVSDDTRPGLDRVASLTGIATLSSSAFNGTASTNPVDSDANGLYDSLTVNFAVNATKDGTYRVIATLSDVEGNEIADGWTSNIVCSAGTRTFSVEFDGHDIYNNGKCGGYVISSAKLIEIGDDYEAVVDERVNLFTTTDYSYEQFEHSLVGLSSGGSDSAIDSNGDGVYDKLNVTIPVYADDRIAGNYSWSASLFDSEGNTLSIASGNLTFKAGEGGTTVTLSFPGQEIAQTDLDGPFYIKSLIIWNYNASYSLSGEYATQPYSIKQWGGTPRHKPRYDFVEKTFSADEGEKLVVTIAGGDEEGPCSMQVYLTYNTAAAADLDLTKGSVNGVVPKGGLKFPLTVSWAADETGAKTIEIPVQADTTFEADEFFTLQLADPSGMALGDFRVCTAKIHDRNTKVTLADAINNPTLKPSTSGAGKWVAVESWAADPDETHCAAFVESPAGLLAGKTATLSFGTQKGAGTLSFDMKFVGDDVGGASFVEVYEGKTLLKTFTMSGNGAGWKSCQVSSSTSGSRALSIVMTQGADLTSRVRITNVAWKPSSTSAFAVLGIEVYPVGAGFASGSGTYAKGSKVNLSATPRPGHTFVGWYQTSGSLFSTKAKTTGVLNGNAGLIALFSKDPYVRGLADPAPAGKVAGSGPCPSGKKVTLKATANKGYVFEGWYNEREVRLTQAASLIVDNSAKPTKPSATTYVVTNVVSDATYYARFVTVEEDKANISCTVGNIVFPVGSSMPIDVELPCGVWVDWPVLSAGLSQTTVKVAGLPTGLKYNTKTGSIEGSPSAPSKKNAKTGVIVPSVVKVTVTTAGKSTKDFIVNITVAEMPAAAVGTFNGFVSPYDSDANKFYRSLSTASFTLTTTAAGKITAKSESPRGAVSFSANYWDELADDTYSALLVARTGEMLVLYVDGKPQYWNGDNQACGYIKGGSFGSEWLYVEAQRSSFLKSGKDYEHPEAIDLAKAMQGTYKFDAVYQGSGAYSLVPIAGRTAPLTLTIKNTGAVTVAGTIPGTAYRFSGAGTMRVYPSSGEVEILVCGKSGKSVNVMVILDAVLDSETGSSDFDGKVFINMVK